MTDENGKIEEWMYEFAWRLLDIAEKGNNAIDEKARNTINFSGILIPIITGFLFFSSGSKLAMPMEVYLFIVMSLLALIISIFFAYKTVWSIDHKIIDTKDHFNQCKDDDVNEILLKTSRTVATWQKNSIGINKTKRKLLKKSNYSFIAALILIIVSALLFISITFYHSLSP